MASEAEFTEGDYKDVAASALQRACAARVLVAITFQFRSDRLSFLAEVLQSLAEYPIKAMDVVIVTNTSRGG
jgi:hypothetical protein